MVKSGCVEYLHARSHGTALRFVGAVNQPRDARLHKRARAHGARLDGHVEGRADQAMIAGLLCGLAQGDDFSVSGGITVGDGAITRGGENPVVLHDERAYGHLSAQRGGLRLRDGQMHVLEIVHGCGGAEEGIRHSTSTTS